MTQEQLNPFALLHPALTSTKVRHGFFTRKGGVSLSPYDSLNVGLGSKDNPDHVLENRARVAHSFGQTPKRLYTLYQTHSAEAFIVDEANLDQQRLHGDGLVTASSNIILGVLSADCAPILFSDPQNNIIGACHAGWKGALLGIIEATLEKMCQIGAHVDQIKAVIGPTIGKESYEVSASYVDHFIQKDDMSASFFTKAHLNEKSYFDLPGYCQMRLLRAGVNNAHYTGHDTLMNEELFFSNRRSFHCGAQDYGRLISAIMIAN